MLSPSSNFLTFAFVDDGDNCTGIFFSARKIMMSLIAFFVSFLPTIFSFSIFFYTPVLNCNAIILREKTNEFQTLKEQKLKTCTANNNFLLNFCFIISSHTHTQILQDIYGRFLPNLFVKIFANLLLQLRRDDD